MSLITGSSSFCARSPSPRRPTFPHCTSAASSPASHSDDHRSVAIGAHTRRRPSCDRRAPSSLRGFLLTVTSPSSPSVLHRRRARGRVRCYSLRRETSGRGHVPSHRRDALAQHAALATSCTTESRSLWPPARASQLGRFRLPSRLRRVLLVSRVRRTSARWEVAFVYIVS